MQGQPILNLDAIREPVVPPMDDRKAEKEAEKFFADLNRKEKVKNVLNWVFIIFIIIASSIAIIVISVRLTHLVLPDRYQWLTADQIQGIDKLFFSGAIGGLIVSYFKKASDS